MDDNELEGDPFPLGGDDVIDDDTGDADTAEPCAMRGASA